MIGLTLKHLRYFEALAANGHFGRAARACGISQPALSLQIKELETMLGGPLVERGARGVLLTALGEDFVVRARRILADVDDLGDLARAGGRDFTGRFRLGVIPTVAPYRLVDMLRALRDRFPNLDVQPREAVTDALLEDLRAAALDAAVVALPVSEPSLQECALFEEPFVLVRPAADAGRPAPAPAQLRDLRLLLLEEGHCFRDQALSFCEIDADDARSLIEGSSLTTLVQMVGAGFGATLIPEMAVDIETKSAEVSIARFDGRQPSRRIGLVWRKSHVLSQRLTDVGAMLRDALSRPQPDGSATDDERRSQ